jgi:hypothetical protein
MLAIKIVMGSSCEELFAKKCCNYSDQNLEIQLTNKGDKPLSIPSFCDFASNEGKLDRIDYLMPHGNLCLEPGQSASFYCYMDENKFKNYNQVIFHDDAGNKYNSPIVVLS